ncbi:hypothetical protein AB1Y20_020292 [Prymnesium parvum]|uniref:Uncharacterized protein n=1 Tax=Prymnesium parvum TaxID=97485 RepID=A0AB34JT69_PRYPA
MALTEERENPDVMSDVDEEVGAAVGGKRPAAVAPLEEPPPTRGRPTDGPPGGPPVGVGCAAPLPTPPEEEVSAESLFEEHQSTHPSEGVTPHGPRTESATARKPTGKQRKLGWLTVSCPANTQGKLVFADVEDAVSILLLDLTDESRDGGAMAGIPTSPKLVDDSIPSGPWFFAFENHWIAMQIASAAQGKLIVDTGDGSLVCNLTTLKTSKDEGAHRLFEASGFWMELYVPKDMVGHLNERTAAEPHL